MNKFCVIPLIILVCGCTIPFLNEEEVFKVKVSWLGHAGFLIESSSTRIYINPSTAPVGSLKGDGILISQSGADLCDISKIVELSKEDTIIIAPPDCSARLSMPNMIPIRVNQLYNIEDFTIETVHAYNFNGTIDKGQGFGLIISYNGTKLYYVGISDLIPEMNDLQNTVFDVVMFPIAGGDLTMDPNEALTFIKLIKSIYYVPMYYGGNTGTALDSGRTMQQLGVQEGINVTLLSNQDLLLN